MARTKKLSGTALITVRLSPELLKGLDEWARGETPTPGEKAFSRNDLIGRELAKGLRAHEAEAFRAKSVGESPGLPGTDEREGPEVEGA